MDVSFFSFFQQVTSNPVLLITVLLTMGVIFVNGWTDAPNAIATCIATRCMRVRPVIMMSAVFNFLGVLVMTGINSSVASTISNMVDFGGETDKALVALCAALFSIVVYSVAASVFGIPTSESHSPRAAAEQVVLWRPARKKFVIHTVLITLPPTSRQATVVFRLLRATPSK